jgi:hypothetical protein
MTEEGNMGKQNVTKVLLAAGLGIAAASFPAAGQAEYALVTSGSPLCPPTQTVCNTSTIGSSITAARRTAKEQRAAAAVTAVQANARQTAVVAHGEANSVLSNPYIEQKVTVPEAVGVNATRVPAGGF